MMGGYNLKEQQAKFDKLHTIFDKDKADYAHNLWLEKKKAHEGRETLNSLREKRALEFKQQAIDGHKMVAQSRLNNSNVRGGQAAISTSSRTSQNDNGSSGGTALGLGLLLLFGAGFAASNSNEPDKKG